MAENSNSVASVRTDQSSLNGINHFQDHLSRELIQFLKSQANEDIANISTLSGYSNKLVRIKFESGRSMIVKQSQYDWAAPRFRSARCASRLIRENSDIIAPDHIAIPHEMTEMPTLAYWYLSAPTLRDLWPRLSQSKKRKAAISLGQLLKKMHGITVDNYGTLHSDEGYSSALDYVYSDLCGRLEPTIGAKWPDILPVVYKLMQSAETMQENEQVPMLVHNDFHIGNVLCSVENEDVNCVGLLDLEEAGGGRWELDLARAITLHRPLFAGGTLKENCLNNFGRFVIDGYGEKPNTKLLQLFRVYHLLDLGLYSAMNKKHDHARAIGKEAIRLLENTAAVL